MDEETAHVIERNREGAALAWLYRYGYVGACVPIMPVLPSFGTFGSTNVLIFGVPGRAMSIAPVGSTLVWNEWNQRVEVQTPAQVDLNAKIEDGLLQAEQGKTRDLGSFKEFLAQDD